MNKSILPENILVPMIKGYLIEVAGYRAQSQRPFVVSEADRVAAKIRATFGRFDESNKERCASVIRAVMKTETVKAPHPRPANKVNIDHERYVKRVMFEAEARRERDERLRYLYST